MWLIAYSTKSDIQILDELLHGALTFLLHMVYFSVQSQ